MSKKTLPSLLTTIAGALDVRGSELRSIGGFGVLSLNQRFVRSLQTLAPHEQAHLLRIESEDDLRDIKQAALNDQYFEVAAACATELKRRESEQNVTSPNAKVS